MTSLRINTPFDTLTQPSSEQQDLLAGRETLRLESAALLKQADQLDGSFTQALDILQNVKGRVIVSGVGKPGHISKKIAATFASTGTPCSVVHPGEASHGDLGMITENDAVLILSKSGETTELRDMINYCKRFSIPLIAMTANPDSTLGRQADIVLKLADAPEACPNQQAPTTSTTLMIALGDALAIALMKRRGFSATDFKQYHPGGKLGGQLLAVATIMQSGDRLPLVPNNATMAQAVDIMSAHNFGCAIIVDDAGHLKGFISDGDLRRHFAADLMTHPVANIMNPTPMTIGVDALAAAALAIMNQRSITQLVVIDGTKPVGLLRLHDIMKAGVA